MCTQLLLDGISYATNSRSQPPDVSGVQYPDILHQRKALHRDRFDVFAQDGGMKYLRHHEPQPHAFGDQRKLQFISFCLDRRNKWQAALQECCLERLANAAPMGIQNPCV